MADVKNSSLTGSDLKNSSVTSSDIKNGSLLKDDFKSGQLPAGPQGPQGPTGPQGPSGSTPSTTLPSGLTLRGRYIARFTAGAAGEIGGDGISFGFSLAAAPTPHFIPQGGPNVPECPGNVTSPSAQPGHLCVYENNGTNSNAVITKGDGTPGAEPYGAAVAIASDAAGNTTSSGTWAVTAP